MNQNQSQASKLQNALTSLFSALNGRIDDNGYGTIVIPKDSDAVAFGNELNGAAEKLSGTGLYIEFNHGKRTLQLLSADTEFVSKGGNEYVRILSKLKPDVEKAKSILAGFKQAATEAIAMKETPAVVPVNDDIF